MFKGIFWGLMVVAATILVVAVVAVLGPNGERVPTAMVGAATGLAEPEADAGTGADIAGVARPEALRSDPAEATAGEPAADPSGQADAKATVVETEESAETGALALLSPADDNTNEDAADGAEARVTPGESVEEGAPAIELVRVSPDGQIVVAGRSQPGEIVEIVLAGRVVATAEADQGGAFVTVLDGDVAAEPRELVLRVPRRGAGDGTSGKRVALVTVPEEAPAIDSPRQRDKSAVTTALEDAREALEEADAGSGSDGEQLSALDPALGGTSGEDPATKPVIGYQTSAPVIILPREAPDAAPLVVVPGPERLEVVQPAETADRSGLLLDKLSYRSGGDVVASGHGQADEVVRAYVNGVLVEEVPIGDDGGWQASLPSGVAEDAALLRFDTISGAGDVTARVETLFSYETDGAVQTLRNREIVIQRGNNLWRIAEQYYGEGLRYSVIFGANQALIRDPDLIYPGQVFAVPELIDGQ